MLKTLPLLTSLMVLSTLFCFGTYPVHAQEKPAASPKTEIFADFESGNYDGWTLEGNAFGTDPASDMTFPGKITGFGGKRFVCTLDPKLGNNAIGKATSKEFMINKPFIDFKIGGGKYPKEACINLVADGKIIKTATGSNTPQLQEYVWNVSDFVGKAAHIEILDTTQSSERGYIMVDDISFRDNGALVEKPTQKVKPLQAQGDLPANDWERSVLRTANYYRRLMGLPYLRWDRRLAQAARLHSDFRSRHWGTDNSGPHNETPGLFGFTGSEPQQRMIAAGFHNGRSHFECMTYNDQSAEQLVTDLFLSFYHGAPFRDPNMRFIGAGLSQKGEGIIRPGIGTFDFVATANTSQIVLYPVPDQTNVPSNGRMGEIPDFLRMHREQKIARIENGVKIVEQPDLIGTLISYEYYGQGKVQVSRATVANSKNIEVPCWKNTPANDDQMRTSSIYLIPKNRLKRNETYTVTVTAVSSTGEDVSRSWKFTTLPNTNASPIVADYSKLANPSQDEIKLRGKLTSINAEDNTYFVEVTELEMPRKDEWDRENKIKKLKQPQRWAVKVGKETMLRGLGNIHGIDKPSEIINIGDNLAVIGRGSISNFTLAARILLKK